MLGGFITFLRWLAESADQGSRADAELSRYRAEAISKIYRAARITREHIDAHGLETKSQLIAELWSDAAQSAVNLNFELALTCRLKELGWGMGWQQIEVARAREHGQNLSLDHLISTSECLIAPPTKAAVDHEITRTRERAGRIH